MNIDRSIPFYVLLAATLASPIAVVSTAPAHPPHGRPAFHSGGTNQAQMPEEIKAHLEQLRALRERMRAEIKTVLTPEQGATLDAFITAREERHDRRPWRMPLDGPPPAADEGAPASDAGAPHPSFRAGPPPMAQGFDMIAFKPKVAMMQKHLGLSEPQVAQVTAIMERFRSETLRWIDALPLPPRLQD